MQRPAKRLSRILACAAVVPVVLAAAGCSSGGSGDDSDAKGGDNGGGQVSASPTAPARAKYASLPEACKTVTSKTLDKLVPEADSKSGKRGESADIKTRGSCSWNSLDNKGVKGSQFRWLNVALLRFDSDTARGTGDKQATDYYAKQVAAARATEGAANARTTPLSGTGDEATTVRYDLKKKEGAFKQQTVVVRVDNVVITVDYDGAGLAGEKTPDADDLTKDAQLAAKDAVAAVTATTDAPPDSSGSSGSPSGSPAKSQDSSGKSSGSLSG